VTVLSAPAVMRDGDLLGRLLDLTLSVPATIRPTARSLRVRVSSSLPAQLVVNGAGDRAQRFAVDRRPRRLTIRARRGSTPLNLRFTLRAGRLSNVRAVTVARR
jgi:hypothetical protein